MPLGIEGGADSSLLRGCVPVGSPLGSEGGVRPCCVTRREGVDFSIVSFGRHSLLDLFQVSEHYGFYGSKVSF